MSDALTHYDKQLILYTKGWFKQTSLVEDIKIIAGEYYNIEPKNLNKIDAFRFVGKVFYKLKQYNHIQHTNELDVFLELFHRVKLWKGKDDVDIMDVIDYMCSKISSVVVLGRIDLGEPDYTILPKVYSVDEEVT